MQAKYHTMPAAPPKSADYVLGLGSNMGDRLQNLRAAVAGLKRNHIQVLAKSTVYRTPPMGPPQPDYFNAAVLVFSPIPARDLLRIAMDVERSLGRIRPDPVRWGARTIDIDLLWCSAGKVTLTDLVVPHPGLQDRAFALRPLLDVVPTAADSAGQPYADLPAAAVALEQVEPL